MRSLSRVRLFVTPWTVAYQAPLSMGFSRQEYWSGLPFPSPKQLLGHAKNVHLSKFIFPVLQLQKAHSGYALCYCIFYQMYTCHCISRV